MQRRVTAVCLSALASLHHVVAALLHVSFDPWVVTVCTLGGEGSGGGRRRRRRVGGA